MVFSAFLVCLPAAAPQIRRHSSFTFSLGKTIYGPLEPFSPLHSALGIDQFLVELP